MQRQLRKISGPSFVPGALVELVACAVVYRGHLSKLLRTWLTRGFGIVDEEVQVTSGDWEVSQHPPIQCIRPRAALWSAGSIIE